MIQRIQSVYLLLTSLLSALFLKGNILTFKKDSGSDIVMNIKGAWQYSVTGSTELVRDQSPVLVILILIILLSVAAIFFYRKRKLQMKMTLGLIILIVFFIGTFFFYALAVINKYQVTLEPGYKMFIPLLMILFAVLAYLGIRKDEELVKSYNRLR